MRGGYWRAVVGAVLLSGLLLADGVRGQDRAAQGELTFSAWDQDNAEIFLVDSDGQNLRNLTNNPANDFDPSWSPDGAQLAFRSNRDGQYDLYVMDADSGNVHRLTNSPQAELNPQWSPDGGWMAFAQEKEDSQPPIYSFNLKLIRLDGSDERVLIHVENDRYDGFAWSPDSHFIAYYSMSGARLEDMGIYVVDIAAGETRLVVNRQDVNRYMEWMPDGRLIYTSGDAEVCQVNALDIRTNQAERIARIQCTSHKLAWSPDHLRLVYSIPRPGQPPTASLYWLDWLTLARREAVTGFYVDNAAWSPDGESVAFLMRQGDTVSISLMNADGEDIRPVITGDGRVGAPIWRPQHKRG